MQKTLLIISLLFLAGFANTTTHDEIKSLWESWKAQHGKSYSDQEEETRFGIFADNHYKIQKLNQESDSAQFAINKFADLTASEFENLHIGFRSSRSDLVNQGFFLEDTPDFLPQNLPASVDWRNKGAVTPVKDMGKCNAHWAFAATGAIEGAYFIKNGQLLSFSEQQIIDCDITENGCGYGFPDLAFKYVEYSGIETEDDYPYLGEVGKCKYNKTKTYNIVTGYDFITSNSTDSLKAAVVKQPVTVFLDAKADVFQFYSSGVIKTGCGNYLNLNALLVGYQMIGAIEAFIVKNAWGTDWGMDGYAQIWTLNSANNGEGVCGILSQPVIPTF